MDKFTIHVVDDEESIRKGLKASFKQKYHVKTFSSAESALSEMVNRTPQLVLLDIGLPGMGGIEALEKIKTISPETLVIMITGYEDLNTVVTAIRAGAYDYIVKPLQIDALRVTIENALKTVSMRKEINNLQELYLQEKVPCFVSESATVQEIMAYIDKIARSPDAPVLIVGESGTGKEIIAKTIHYKSPYYEGPFVPINCSAIPRDLLESELFGYEKGAFSGARSTGKRGLVEEADGGTLFLDEIADLSFEAQAKLLRFLEEGEFYKVGGTRPRKVSTRVVSATNYNLMEQVEKGRFREDLYFRLAVIKIEVPSLEERKEDIVPIANFFLNQFNTKYRKSFKGLSPAAEAALKNHRWKGNVRELKSAIERAVLTAGGVLLEPHDLGIESGCRFASNSRSVKTGMFPRLPESGIDLPALEKHLIMEALERTSGNRVKAAELLGLSYYTFRYRLRKIMSE
ncbi:MAG TPA: sigma-54-dependent Fis family transcriptional regulator [Deltaproteobacteria bacterium]|nr:sigma-54-dependent Fis family transcriptional regulator [Deltaproteobacteria bacterium]